MLKKVMFACMGNTCRSPMAEYILKGMLEKDGVEGVIVCSGGISAAASASATEQAIAVMLELGADLSPHCSSSAGVFVSDADLIYCMTAQYAEIIKLLYPERAGAVRTLDDTDIDDPYGGTLEQYRQCRDQIKAAICKIYENQIINE